MRTRIEVHPLQNRAMSGFQEQEDSLIYLTWK
jgi:hypothetical protein